MSNIVDKVFKTHPKAQKVFTTSDGMPFLNEHNAKMNAANLPDKKITTHTRKAELSEEDKQKKADEKAKKAEEKTKTEANKVAIKNGEANVNLKPATVTEVTEWAEKQNDVEVLNKALETVDTQGGKKAVNARIEALKTQNVEGSQGE